ncbi:hypothetical protein CC80DRAFT_413900 [Byssothecium circinans]|uniref:Uncharacterized protein n=1 Tax=Byssothecium circinans TaxID=147558 RepID=A0A6A5TW09_9PLEO|nr:hypothetical protein CC80DRAFT_413900 [Byssothecium circinans]
MEHFAPHPNAAFEGWYSKFALPSGAHIALVICAVPNATSLPPYMVSFTYYPASGDRIFQREHWHSPSSSNPHQRIPNNTPEGWLVHFPLPLHWHVHSLSSPAAFRLDIPSLFLPKADEKGRATVHQEKNWANSFPSAHVWLQARDQDSETGICLAGGRVLGMHAFILGFRSPSLDVDVVPPFTLSILGMSPFMRFSVDYEGRGFEIEARNWTHKVVMRARAPNEKGWFGLGAPFKEGHRTDFCTESFLAVVEVRVFEKMGWFGAWEEVGREKFEGASLEFAGEWFEDRGRKRE